MLLLQEDAATGVSPPLNESPMSQWKLEGEGLSSLCVRVHFLVLKCYKSINCICLYNEKDYKVNKGIKYKSIFIFEMLEETAVEGSRSASYPEDQQGQQKA